MAKLIIEGGHQLNGTIRIGGAKNSVLKLMAASILGHGSFHITDVPAIDDVRTMVGVLKSLGVQAALHGNELHLAVNGVQGRPPERLVQSMRASVQVMGPLLARLGRAEIALPGGCAIGSRPLDIHLDGLRRLGAQIEEVEGRIIARAEVLTGADLTLRYPSVGATENILMAATLARGTTVIRNAAKEPEIVDIQDFLNRMGASVQGAGTSVITIHGVPDLGCADYRVIPDRIEAGTYVIAAAATGGELHLLNVVPHHLEPLLRILTAMGVPIEVGERTVRVYRAGRLHPAQVQTAPYPGFPTDLQPQFTALTLRAFGQSIVRESIYDNRFGYTTELRKLGAEIAVSQNRAVVNGGRPLFGAKLSAGDLRGGAALIIAGLMAEGVSEVAGLHHVDRGYENIAGQLQSLGARVVRLETGGDGY